MKFNRQKAFGQHFLNDAKTIEQIVRAAEEYGNRFLSENGEFILLEIGPGKGAITFPLLKSIKEGRIKPAEFWIAEKDYEFIRDWNEQRLVGEPIQGILEGDFLETCTELFDRVSKMGKPLLVVSNLPYSAGTQILLALDEAKALIPAMVLMFQAEVSQKLYAKPSTSKRGSLSVYMQNHWDVSLLCKVPPRSFTPPPKVDSEVVCLERRHEPFVCLSDRETTATWNDLLRTAFKQRRKMLRGNFSSTKFEKAFVNSGVESSLRAEALDWPEWKKIWDQIWKK